jgi:hypothetical protein
MPTGGPAFDDMAYGGGRDLDAALAGSRQRFREIPINGRLPGSLNDRSFHDEKAARDPNEAAALGEGFIQPVVDSRKGQSARPDFAMCSGTLSVSEL